MVQRLDTLAIVLFPRLCRYFIPDHAAKSERRLEYNRDHSFVLKLLIRGYQLDIQLDRTLTYMVVVEYDASPGVYPYLHAYFYFLVLFLH